MNQLNTMNEILRLAEMIRQSNNRSILETICKTDTLYATLAALTDTLMHGSGVFTVVTGVWNMAAKANGTAKRKLNEKMLEYEDSLNIKMADFRAKLAPNRSILATPDISVLARAWQPSSRSSKPTADSTSRFATTLARSCPDWPTFRSIA